MVVNKVRRIIWGKLLRIVRSHRRTHKLAVNAYRRYQNPKINREFHSRISQVNPNDYLDTSHKPNLNVIIIVVDSLRNSRLSCQGYTRETTPFLDSLKTRFTAISAAPWTYPSVASILTGLYPHNHNAVLAGKMKDWGKYESYLKLRGDILTLPEMLHLLGYKIFFGSAIGPDCDALRARVVPKQYDPFTRAEDILNDFIKWIAEQKENNFFAYFQLGDLHPPLNIPHCFSNFFGDVKDLPNINKWDFIKPQQRERDSERFQEYRENRELLYDNALRYVDYAIKRYYDSLQDMGLLDSTVFIVTADHGEQFWEHAELDAGNFYLTSGVCGISHGDNTYNEVIQVPLLVSGPIPDIKPDRFISTVDIMPTVVDLLGITHDIRFDGRNIFETEEERTLLSEAVSSGYEKKALIAGRYKLIYSKDDRIAWVFNLEKDPQEQHPIVDKEVTSVFVEKLHQMLREDEKRKISGVARKKSL